MTDITDYCPVSLIHNLAKILAKAMASQLAVVDAIGGGEVQRIYQRSLDHQQFHAGPPLHSHSLHRWQVDALMLKLDVAKDLDSVAWSFLLQVLPQGGFSPR